VSNQEIDYENSSCVSDHLRRFILNPVLSVRQEKQWIYGII